jgi:predicted secreted Zn-dependent protease
MRALLPLLLVSCVPDSGAPKPAVRATWEAQTVEYRVGGRTPEELTTSLRRRADALLPDILDEQHFGQHAWTVQTGWDELLDPDHGCGAAEIRVHATSMVVVPSWVPDEGVDSGLVDVWECYAAALTAHEENHRAIARAGLDEMTAAFGSLVPVPTCSAMDAAISDVREAVMADVRERQLAYDVESDHGRNEDCR